MNLNNIKTLIILLLNFSIFSSCKDNHEHDDETVTVQIVSPAANTTHNEKDTLWIKVNLSTTTELHEYLIEIKNLTTDSVVYKYEGHSHQKSVSTNLWWLPQVSSNSAMQLIVTTLNHNGEKQITTSNFQVINQVENGPTITLTKPTGDEMPVNGSVIDIVGHIETANTLQTAMIVVTKNGETTPVFSFSIPVNGLKHVQFDTSYTINTGGAHHLEYAFSVNAEDNKQLKSSKTVILDVH